MWRPALYWSPENLGRSTPTPAKLYRTNPEQSKPTVLAPESTPLLGPFSVPPPHEYGNPICEDPRRITYSTACRPYTRGMPLGLVLAVPPRLSPSPPRNCRPRSSVVWVAFAVACRDWLAIATGSPGAPALIVAGRVGSHAPSSAFAGPARPITRAKAASVGQTSPARRNPLAFSDGRRLNQRRINPSRASVLDVADYVGRHTAGADRCDPDLQPDVGGLEHLTVAEIDRHVLTAAGAVEDHVAAAHLRRRDLAAQVVLRARVVRQLDAHPGERVQHQARAVEADSAGPRGESRIRTPAVRTPAECGRWCSRWVWGPAPSAARSCGPCWR